MAKHWLRILAIFSITLLAGLIGNLVPANLVLADQIDLPPAVDVNLDPNIFEATRTAQTAVVDLDGSGLLANVYSFNGIVPGPEIRVKQGDSVIVHFVNNLSGPASIHWHGIELNNFSDGTGVTQDEVMPGGTYEYNFIVPRPGVYWYHSHMMPTNPEFKGVYASLIVTSPDEQTLINQSK